MRWLVEVASIGKNDKETLCVEADSWQRALQVTRTLRKETAPMSGFSIELLDDGCRAVDPMSRMRYEVKRTRDDAPLTPGAEHAASATKSASHAPPAPSQPPPAAANVPRPVNNPPPAAKRPAVGKTTAFMGSGTAASGAQLQQVSEPAKPPPPAAPIAAPAPIAARPVAPIAAHAPAPAAPAPPAGASSQIIFKREQDPTDAVPLAYREYVYVVAQGTTEAAAEGVLRAQLDQVRASIAPLPPGKLVQLAVFDVMFRGRPPVRPLATLVWKDWRDDLYIGFPRRPDYVPPKTAPPPVAFAPPPPPVAFAPPPPPVAFAPPPAPVAFAPPPAPADFTPPPPAAVAPPPPSQRPVAPDFHIPPPAAPAPLGPNDTQPLPAQAAPIAPAPVPAAPAQAVAAQPPAPDFARTMATRPSSASMRAARPRGRANGDELIADLFEAMHDLHFVRDAIDGGAFCLTLALEKLPAHFGIVHLYDIGRREFVVTSTNGVGAHVLLLARHPESEPLLLAAMHKRRAIVIADATLVEPSHAASLGRYAALGQVRSMIVAPVMQAGRFLGAIELINPIDGNPFTADEGNALNYIAEQFGEFVANVGVVTDPDRITAAASAPARR